MFIIQTLKVLVFEPFKPGYEKTIEDSSDVFEEIVEGYYQIVRTDRKDLIIICNEEGMIRKLPKDRGFYGTFFVVGFIRDNYVSLNEEQIKATMDALEHRENYVCKSKSLANYFKEKNLKNKTFDYDIGNCFIIKESDSIVSHILSEENDIKLEQYEMDIKAIEDDKKNIYDYLKDIGEKMAIAQHDFYLKKGLLKK